MSDPIKKKVPPSPAFNNCITVMCIIILASMCFILAVRHFKPNPDQLPPPKAEERDPAIVARNEAIDVRVEAENNLRATLKDGDSAKLEEMFVSRISKDAYALCGKVNAKNSFGAYTGYQRFIASRNSDGPVLIDDASRIFKQAYALFCSSPVIRF